MAGLAKNSGTTPGVVGGAKAGCVVGGAKADALGLWQIRQLCWSSRVKCGHDRV